MSRPKENTVVYFPHYISDGKKMFYIENKYGNDGYSTWFKILESLALTKNHFLDLSDKIDVMFLSAKCKIDEEKLFSILNDLAILREIDDELWDQKIVFSEKFIESIADAYKRRNSKCMQKHDLCVHLSSLCRINVTETDLLQKKNDNNPQSKVKYSKVNEIKVNENITFKKSKQNIIEKKAIEIILPFSDAEFETAWLNWKEFKLKEKRFKYASPVSEAMALKSLVSKSNNNSNTAIKIIEQAIEFGWSGFFPLKNIQNGNSNQKLTASEQLDKLKREFDERIDSAFIQQPIENGSEDVGYVCLE